MKSWKSVPQKLRRTAKFTSGNSQSIQRRAFLAVVNQSRKVGGIGGGKTVYVSLEFQQGAKQATALIRQPDNHIIICNVNLRDITRAMQAQKKSLLSFKSRRSAWLSSIHAPNRKSAIANRKSK